MTMKKHYQMMTAEISETDGSTSKDILSIRKQLKSTGIRSHQVIVKY